MASTTFSGPVLAGDVREGGSANVGYVVMAQSANHVFGANGTVTNLFTLPANSQVLDFEVDITTDYDAGTTNTLDIGTAATPGLYATAIDIGTVGKILASSDVSQIANMVDIGTSDVLVQARYNQTGGAATAGASVITVKYLQNRNVTA